MTLSIDTIFCLGLGASIFVAVLVESVHRLRTGHRTIADSLAGMKRIEEAVSQLPNLEPKERAASRRLIAREILIDTGFVLSMMSDCYRDDPPKDAQVRERTLAVAREIMLLNWELRKSLFLFRFRPGLAGDCRRILVAAYGYYRVRIAYIHFLKARYPELYGDISAPDIC